MPTAVAEAAGEGATAFGVLSTLLQQHSSLQSEIAQDQRDITAGKARETTANQAVKQATSEVTQLQAELSKRQDYRRPDQEAGQRTQGAKDKGVTTAFTPTVGFSVLYTLGHLRHR